SAFDGPPVSLRFHSSRVRPRPLLATAGLVHQKEIPSNNRRVSHCRPSDIHSASASTPVPIASTPTVARKFDPPSTCLPVQDRPVRGRVIRPAELMPGTPPVSLPLRGPSHSLEN